MSLTAERALGLLRLMVKDYLNVILESEDFDTNLVEIHKIEGSEILSQLFFFDLEIIFKGETGIDLDDLAGAEVAIVFQRADTTMRSVYGMVCEAEDVYSTEEAYVAYRIKVVPRAWRLSLVETIEIFMDMSIIDIIKSRLEKVRLDEEGLDYEFRLLGTYPEKEFVVQYQETDISFISRLTEHIGITYFFEHNAGRDKMVFTDHAGGFHPIVGDSTVPYRGRGEQIDVYQFSTKRKLIPTAYVCRDYNYRTPQVDLQSSQKLSEGFAGGIIEYGSHFKTPAEGQQFATVRSQEQLAQREVHRGESDVQRLAAGQKFSLSGHPRQNPSMLVVEVHHRATQSVGLRGAGDERTYRNHFTTVDASLHYRPPRITPRPFVPGVLTGVVETDAEGSVGKYAKIDNQGRYTVRFMFDYAPPGEHKASRPVRRIQPTAGPNYGMHFPLRPGIEVLITFVGGDPDRPIIVGAVPNPLTPSPIENSTSTKNRIKTESGVLFEIEDGSGS